MNFKIRASKGQFEKISVEDSIIWKIKIENIRRKISESED